MDDLIQDINSKEDAIISNKLKKNKIRNEFEKTRSDIKLKAKIQKKSIKRSQIDLIKNSLKKKRKSSSKTNASDIVNSEKEGKKVRFDV